MLDCEQESQSIVRKARNIFNPAAGDQSVTEPLNSNTGAPLRVLSACDPHRC